MDVRDEIASLFAVARRAGAQDKPGDSEDFARLVLAIPRIAAALKLLDEHERLMLGGSVSTGVKLRPTK